MKNKQYNLLTSYFSKSILISIICCTISLQKTQAQLSQMGSMYFQNQYMGNPAFAGTEKGMNINAGYRSQWNNIPGSPTLQTLTASYAFAKKAGAGINIYNDQAGLISRTRAVASYAYHLPLNDEGKTIHFGLSFGMMNERINNDKLDGDPDDLLIRTFNDRQTYLDGDFGAAYVGQRLTIQAALTNMKMIFEKDMVENSVDRNLFFSAISYKMTLSQGTNGFGLEPKVAYRGIKGFDNILDAGLNISYAESKLNLFGMYHSTNNATVGLGFRYEMVGINTIYTSPTSGMRNYSTGDFEIALNLRLAK